MTTSGPLAGVRVVDLATLVAGPGIARHLADFGAEVLKVEPPEGDPARRLGWTPEGDPDSFYWKLVARGKRCITLDLVRDDDRDRFLALTDAADVLVENMRPGKLEALGFGPERLRARNPRLVVVRVTGFGQTGPYAQRPGFATMAEAMSGYADLCGLPGGQPLLPPVALTDEVSALAGAFATMVALWHARESGEGQDVDVSLLDTALQLLGPLPAANAHLGYEQPRLGAGIPYSSPRGTYRCADGRWVAVSASSDTVARRVLGLLGVADDDRFATFADRLVHREPLEELMTGWIAGRSAAEVMGAFEDIDAAVALVYSMSEVLADPHVRERASVTDVDGVVMQNVVARLGRTPGRPGSPGPASDGVAPGH